MNEIKQSVGNILIGVWYCDKCKASWFPNQILNILQKGDNIKQNKSFYCVQCGNHLKYEEEA